MKELRQVSERSCARQSCTPARPTHAFTTMDKLLPRDKSRCVELFVQASSACRHSFSPNEDQLYKAFYHAFVEERIHVAFEDGVPVVLLALSDNKTCAMEFLLDEFQKGIGGIKGSVGQIAFTRMFKRDKALPNHTASIDFVILKDNDQRYLEIAQQLVSHVISKHAYRSYVFVAPARSLADKVGQLMGFKVFSRKGILFAHFALGISHFVYRQKVVCPAS